MRVRRQRSAFSHKEKSYHYQECQCFLVGSELLIFIVEKKGKMMRGDDLSGTSSYLNTYGLMNLV